MSANCRILIASFAIIWLLAGCQKPSSSVQQQICKQQMHSLWAAIKLYRWENTNQWPTKLEQLDMDLVGGILVCPGAKAGAIPGQIDYVYVYPMLYHGSNVPSGKCPVLYDRRMSNHGNRGINIMMEDGTVEWDKNGEWLQKFAREHSGARLAIPE